jgi:hypothetical protein
MEILLRSLTQYSGQILLLLCVFNAGLAVAYFRRARNQDRVNAALKEILRDSSGENLESLLQRHLYEREQIQRELRSLSERAQSLETELAVSKRHVGMVRYDAFEDVGGSQSFALAIYDDGGNGAILNGVVGRADARVYCKPLVNGRSERNLSQEEQRAIREARDSGPKSIISS